MDTQQKEYETGKFNLRDIPEHLRKYFEGGQKELNFNFEGMAKELYRVLKQGRILVWVVGDETKNFCESLTSFKQAIYFVEEVGFSLLDTMIYKKESCPPAYPNLKRYANSFEYMLVFSKGNPITFNCQEELKVNIERGFKPERRAFRKNDDSLEYKTICAMKTMKGRTNVWEYMAAPHGSNQIKYEHPATFPDKLAQDHILSWSNPGDLVLDPMCGSGTTCKMALKNGRRYIGIDMNPEYVEISKKRIEKENQQLKMKF